MTKSELIEILAAQQTQLAAKDAELAVKKILDIMSEASRKASASRSAASAAFSLNYRPPRKGRNPKTGEKVRCPGKYVPHFKPGKELRERVNDGAGEPIHD